METMKLSCLTVCVIILTGVCCSTNPVDDVYDEIQYEQEKSWISEHVWIPIVGGIVFLILIILLCTCCCCGCCACCRSNTPNVIVQSGQPSTHVSMASATNVVQSNPYHAGYNQ